jgi:parallel beta-helix repeat protein
MTDYPNNFDTDANIPRIDNNITEIGGDSINGLRSAVFSIEQTLGLNPQGTAADVDARLDQSLNSDGTIKASALSGVGLVTLPITNSMVGSTAGILESKLDLNYTTKTLRELIGALRTEHDSLVITVQADITNLARHIAHPGTYGRHYTSDVDGYVGKYITYNLQGIINDLDTRITDHVSDPLDAHDASAISFDDSDTSISASEVQSAIEALDVIGITTTGTHQDDQHSNGILKAQEVFEDNENHANIVVSSATLNSISSGAIMVSYNGTPPSELSEVQRGDRIDVTIGSTIYKRDIESVNVTSGIVYFLDAIPVNSTSSTAVIYKNSSETSKPSMLALAIRHDSISGNFGGSVVQLIHPNAPSILSNGLDTRKITSTTKYVKFRWSDDETIDIDVLTALQTYPITNTNPSTWTAENLAIALNEEFKVDGRNYPLIAFAYKGEVGIAYDEPDGYIELRTPTTNSAWGTSGAFGLAGSEIDYSLGPRRFYVDGYQFSGIRKIVDATAVTDNTTAIKSINADLTALGVTAGGIVRVKNHSDAGTYVFDGVGSSTLTINSHIGGFATDTSVNVSVYADSFSIPLTPGERILYELFMDGYNNEYGMLRGMPRLEYTFGGGSSDSPESWFDIIEISRNFVAGTKRINFQDVSDDKIVKLGDPVTSPPSSKSVTNAGESVTLPLTDPQGFKFKLYDQNNVDYIEIVVASNAYVLITNENAIDITIHDRIGEERYVQIGQVLHNVDRFKHLSDRRLFGTIGRNDIKDDYTRDYVSYPRSLLRGNGVVFGCGVSDSSGDLLVAGGQVLVDGGIYSVDRVLLEVPDESTELYYNVFIDNNGVTNFLQDNQFVNNQITTPLTSEIIASSDKTILARVKISASNTISEVDDYRRFVNNIDDKIDLIVEENSITHGSFASLYAALNHISAQSDPVPKTIRIRGTINHDLTQGTATIPNGVSIVGDGYSSSIINFQGASSSSRAFNVDGYCTISGVGFQGDGTGDPGVIFEREGADITNFVMDSCGINMRNVPGSVTIISATGFENCIFDNTDFHIGSSGVASIFLSSLNNVENLVLKNCNFNFHAATNNNTFMSVSSTYTLGCMIDNCNTTTINTTGAIKLFDAAIDGCSITNSTFTTGSSSSCDFVDTSEDISRLFINNCNISLGQSSGTTTFIDADELDNCSIVSSQITISPSSGTGKCLDVASLTNCFVNNCQISLESTTSNEFITTSGDIIDSFFTNCVVSFATASGTNTGFSLTGDIIDSCIRDMELTNTTSSTSNACISANDATNCSISNCKITNVNTGIIISGTATNVIVNNCEIDETVDDGIRVTTSGENVVIQNNVIQSSDIGTSSSIGFVDLTGIDHLTIDNNRFEYSGTDVPTASSPAMMLLSNCSDYTVSKSLFLNKNSTSEGIKSGLIVSGTSTRGMISDNVFRNLKFKSGSVRGLAVDFSSTSDVTFTGNRMLYCRDGMDITGASNIVISNNYFDLTVGDGDIVGVTLDENTGDLIFSDNMLKNEDTSLAITGLFLYGNNVSSASSAHCFVGNEIIHRNASSISGLLVVLRADNLVFANNVIDCGDFNGSFPPLFIYGGGTSDTSAIAIGNKLGLTYNGASGTSPLTILAYDLDILNKGQVYSSVIPLHYAKQEIEGDTDGGASSWSVGYDCINAWGSKYVSSFEELMHSFGPPFVPIGAYINSIDVYYDSNTAINYRFVKATYTTTTVSDSDIIASTAFSIVTSTGSPQKENITVGTMVAELSTYKLIISASSAGSGNDFKYYGLVVNYTL